VKTIRVIDFKHYTILYLIKPVQEAGVKKLEKMLEDSYYGWLQKYYFNLHLQFKKLTKKTARSKYYTYYFVKEFKFNLARHFQSYE